MNTSNDHPIFEKLFRDIYPCYTAKVERKGRSRDEVARVICWLLGYTEKELVALFASDVTLGAAIDQAPALNPARTQIAGTICGIAVQDLAPGRMQEPRYIDKLIDEIARGKDPVVIPSSINH